MRELACGLLGVVIVSALSAADGASPVSPLDRSDGRAISDAAAEYGSPNKVIQDFEEALATVGRASSAEIGELVLAAAGQIEQLSGAGAPESEVRSVGRRSKSQVAQVVTGGVRVFNDLSERAEARLRSINAPPQWLRYVSILHAESVAALRQAGRWACHLIDEAVESGLSSR